MARIRWRKAAKWAPSVRAAPESNVSIAMNRFAHPRDFLNRAIRGSKAQAAIGRKCRITIV
jgi:hypothetical protein